MTSTSHGLAPQSPHMQLTVLAGPISVTCRSRRRSVVPTVEWASACTAVGYYIDTSGNAHVLIWTGES
jgi:hypothetical protein